MTNPPDPASRHDLAESMHAATWGPFELASPQPIDVRYLDLADTEAWCQVGLLLNPPTLGNDYNRVLRHIRAFMGFVESVTGQLWDVRAESLAVRNFLSREPVVLPFWRDIEVGES